MIKIRKQEEIDNCLFPVVAPDGVWWHRAVYLHFNFKKCGNPDEAFYVFTNEDDEEYTIKDGYLLGNWINQSLRNKGKKLTDGEWEYVITWIYGDGPESVIGNGLISVGENKVIMADAKNKLIQYEG